MSITTRCQPATLGDKRYIGAGTVASGSGTLTGGSNPYDLQMAIDNSNTAGVTDVDADDAASATSGVEGLVPYEEISLDPSADSVKVLVLMQQVDGDVSNQLLPGLGGGL